MFYFRQTKLVYTHLFFVHTKVSEDFKQIKKKIENYEKNADEYWNKFYSIHDNKFFKDRNWLFTEFPELLLEHDPEKNHNVNILEVGCGVGNTIFPILRSNK